MGRKSEFDKYVDKIESVGESVQVPAKTHQQLLCFIYHYKSNPMRNKHGFTFKTKKVEGPNGKSKFYVKAVDKNPPLSITIDDVIGINTKKLIKPDCDGWCGIVSAELKDSEMLIIEIITNDGGYAIHGIEKLDVFSRVCSKNISLSVTLKQRILKIVSEEMPA